MRDFERFEFRPWMAYVAGVLLFAVGSASKSDVGMLLRGLGLTVFFGTGAWSHHTYRKRTGAGASAGEFKSLAFAVLSGLFTLAVLVGLVLALLEKLAR